MTSQADIVHSGAEFRDMLAALSSKGAFSDAERDGFARLHLFYADRLASFQISPRYGDDSPYYENPYHWSEVGKAAAPGCKPGDPGSQQPTYDAANGGGDALEAVTGPPASTGILGKVLGSSFSGIQGSLLSQGGSK